MPKYIDAEGLISHIQEEIDVFLLFDDEGKPFSAVKDAEVIWAIDNFPSANVRDDIHGQWVTGRMGRYVYCRCSECGHRRSYPGDRTPFCPGCGANMDLDKLERGSDTGLEMDFAADWVPMSERLPDEGGKYLVCWDGKTVDTGFFFNGHFRLYGEIKDHLITAWMPLPGPYDSNKVMRKEHDED